MSYRARVPKSRRSSRKGPFQTWAGDSIWRQFVVWLTRSAVGLIVLLVGLAIVLVVLVPNMIDTLTRQFAP